jgi:predicted nucleotidyltransferase
VRGGSTVEEAKLMKEQKLPDLQVLPEVFSKHPGIQAVYVFGSAGDGRTHGESDLDLAIVPRDGTVREKKLDLLTDLARTGFCDVDLALFDTDDIVLKYEMVWRKWLLICWLTHRLRWSAWPTNLCTTSAGGRESVV